MVKQNDIKNKGIKTLAGIDTLYYFCYTDDELYHNFFSLISLDNLSIENDDIEFLCYAGKDNGVIGAKYAFKYNDIHFASVTFKDPNKQQFIDNIYVQLMGSGVYGLGLKVSVDLVSHYLNSLFSYEADYNYMYPSRVDINCFVNGFDFSAISADCFGGFFRSSRNSYVEDYKRGKRLETLYLGSRLGSFYFKIYDKKRELEVKQKELSTHIKKEYLERNGFDFSKEIWNLEFTLKRERLVNFSIHNLTYLFDFYKQLYLNCFLNLTFYGFDTKKVQLYKKHKKLNRLQPHAVWNLVNDNINKQTSFNDIKFEWSDDKVLIHKDIIKNSEESRKKWRKENFYRALNYCKEVGISLDELLAI